MHLFIQQVLKGCFGALFSKRHRSKTYLDISMKLAANGQKYPKSSMTGNSAKISD